MLFVRRAYGMNCESSALFIPFQCDVIVIRRTTAHETQPEEVNFTLSNFFCFLILKKLANLHKIMRSPIIIKHHHNHHNHHNNNWFVCTNPMLYLDLMWEIEEIMAHFRFNSFMSFILTKICSYDVSLFLLHNNTVLNCLEIEDCF